MAAMDYFNELVVTPGLYSSTRRADDDSTSKTLV